MLIVIQRVTTKKKIHIYSEKETRIKMIQWGGGESITKKAVIENKGTKDTTYRK